MPRLWFARPAVLVGICSAARCRSISSMPLATAALAAAGFRRRRRGVASTGADLPGRMRQRGMTTPFSEPDGDLAGLAGRTGVRRPPPPPKQITPANVGWLGSLAHTHDATCRPPITILPESLLTSNENTSAEAKSTQHVCARTAHSKAPRPGHGADWRRFAVIQSLVV